MVDNRIKIENDRLSKEQISKNNEHYDVLDGFIKEASGEEYRGLPIVARGKLGDGVVKEGDLEVQKSLMSYLKLLVELGEMKSETDISKIEKELNAGFVRTREQTKFTLEYQKYLNKLMKEYGFTITGEPTNFEKNAAKLILEDLNYEEKLERFGPDDYTNEIKDGKGKITFYKEDEIWKTLEYEIKDGKAVFGKTVMNQIEEDGVPGVETTRAVLMEMLKRFEMEERMSTVSREVPEPVVEEKNKTIITPAVSLSKRYNEVKEGKIRGGYIDRNSLVSEPREMIYSTMATISYENEQKMREGDMKGELLFNAIDTLNGLNRRRKSTLQKFNEEAETFSKNYQSEEKSNRGIFVLEYKQGEGRGFDIDFSEIDRDFNIMIKKVKEKYPEEIQQKHIEFIENKRSEVKEMFLTIAEKSESITQFEEMATGSHLYATYQGMLINYTKYPLQDNILEMKSARSEASKIAAGELLEDNKYEKRFDFYSVSGVRDVIDLERMREGKIKLRRNREIDYELYEKISTGLVEYEINLIKERYRELSLIERKDLEDKKDEKIDIQIESRISRTPMISPSDEELKRLGESLENDPEFAKLYLTWVNKNFEESGIKTKLEDMNDRAKHLLTDTLVGVEFWNALQEPDSKMEKLLSEYNKKIDVIDNPKLYYEFENYVRMRTYDGEGNYHLQLDSIIGEEKQRIAFQLYGRDFLQEKIEFKETIDMVERDKIECGAFQKFANQNGYKPKLVEDNKIGRLTRAAMYNEDGVPTELLMKYSQMIRNNPEERSRLLEESAKNEQQRTQGRENVDKSYKVSG